MSFSNATAALDRGVTTTRRLAAQRLTAGGAELRLANGTTLLGKLNGELARRLNG